MIAQMSTQTTEAWKVFLNLGAVGVIAFATLSFVAMVVWTLWTVFKRIAQRYLPELFDEAVNTIRAVRESQEGIAKNQELSTKNQELSAASLAELAKLGIAAAKREEGLESILKTKMDPAGVGYRNHVFSSARIEEFLSLSLDLLEEWLEKDTNVALKLDWKTHISAMRKSLQNIQKTPEPMS